MLIKMLTVPDIYCKSALDIYKSADSFVKNNRHLMAQLDGRERNSSLTEAEESLADILEKNIRISLHRKDRAYHALTGTIIVLEAIRQKKAMENARG